ncbi:class I SAM-dependent methyltransferase [Sanguibacter sp. 25GB23B1]|uniref:class I SAM-dependent methyltransferase n=1 Tax=unclassified Sanguibacter TaxID=2645534 RepID=UPI0032AF88C6
MTITWAGPDGTRTAAWRSEGQPAPQRAVAGDDRTTAATAFRLATAGTAIVWHGDFQNARQLLRALARRADRVRQVAPTSSDPAALAAAFHAHRQQRARRAQVLSMLLVPVDPDGTVPLRRAPDLRDAYVEAFGTQDEPVLRSLQELLGAVGAHEWRIKGVDVPALGEPIHPHYGVFSPVRGEYLDLVAEAPLPAGTSAIDVGTGTGVIAAILARRGVADVVGTDQSSRAVACARDNVERLGLSERVRVVEVDLFPPTRASLVVCNPPWLPAEVVSSLDAAVYDPGSTMLRRFLHGLPDHLEPGGEGWLVISDLGERLGLRSRDELLAMIAGAGLVVVERLDTRPRHKRADDAADALHAARSAEVTSLWRLRAGGAPRESDA